MKKINEVVYSKNSLKKFVDKMVDQSMQSLDQNLLKLPTAQRIANYSTSTNNDELIAPSINANVTTARI